MMILNECECTSKYLFIFQLDSKELSHHEFHYEVQTCTQNVCKIILHYLCSDVHHYSVSNGVNHFYFFFLYTLISFQPFHQYRHDKTSTMIKAIEPERDFYPSVTICSGPKYGIFCFCQALISITSITLTYNPL